MSKKCHQCKAAIPANAKFCPQCGTTVAKIAEKTCPKCQAANPATATFCVECGTILQSTLLTSAPGSLKQYFWPLLSTVLLGVIISGVYYYFNFVEPLQKKVAGTNPHNNSTAVASQNNSAAQTTEDEHVHAPTETEIKAVADKLAANPNDETLNIQMGNMLFDSGRYDEAIPYYKKALSINPNNPDVIVDLGVCYFNQKDYVAAKQQFELANKLDPNHVNALYNLGVVSVQNGDINALIKYWNKLQEVAPQSPQAQRAMQILNQIHQDVDQQDENQKSE
jgi:cytochrome c-type biogenesis protein CcmH/NrfG/ribosomal protein L40E